MTARLHRLRRIFFGKNFMELRHLQNILQKREDKIFQKIPEIPVKIFSKKIMELAQSK
jgi:hypothetical protein